MKDLKIKQINKRIKWIDELKGFGILLVTIGHLKPYFFLEKHIYSFHICLFFFLSGYLFQNKCSQPFKSYFIKKFKTLMIPFLFWNFLSTIVDIYFFKNNCANSIKRFFMIDGSICWNAPIWFLLTLFLTEISYAYIYRLCPHNKIIIFVSLIIWLIFGWKPTHLLLNLIPLAILFYGFGHKINSINIEKNKKVEILMTLFLTINILFGVILNIRVSYTHSSFGNIYYFIIAAIAGVVFYVLLFYKIQNLWPKFLESIIVVMGKSSLIIMATQYWLFKIINKIISLINKPSFMLSANQNMFNTILEAIITIYIIITCCSWLKSKFKNNAKCNNIIALIGIR